MMMENTKKDCLVGNMQKKMKNKQIVHENSPDDIKNTLMNKYRAIFVDRLTRQDLHELQILSKSQFDEKRQLNSENKLKFESRLRQYFHEEVMRREIVSIETLLSLLKPEDVKN
jgi:hypothetical protein